MVDILYNTGPEVGKQVGSISQFGKILDVFKSSLNHEQTMTAKLNNLSDQALKEKDHATYNLLQWFVNEQVEEEATVGEIISKLKLVKEDGSWKVDRTSCVNLKVDKLKD